MGPLYAPLLSILVGLASSHLPATGEYSGDMTVFF